MLTPSFIASSFRRRESLVVGHRRPRLQSRVRATDEGTLCEAGRSTTREALRLAIDSLPRQTRVAMLDGLDTNTIIVGAYTNRRGHLPDARGAPRRVGGRARSRSPRRGIGSRSAAARGIARGRASERELMILRSYLEASLLGTSAYGAELERAKSSAIERVEHRGHVQPAIGSEPPEPSERPERPGDPDRSAELAASDGWAWTRVVSRYDDYERVLRQLGSEPPAQVDDGGQRVLSR